MITDEIGGGGGGAGISGSALANLLTGYATQDWVGENYISIEFFSRLFQAHGTENGQQTDIDPNDMDSTITSIESMFGFWTDYYLSALGNGGGLGSTLYLASLADVLISSPANNQVLTYNATTGKWVNANAPTPTTSLSALTDVTLTPPADGEMLIFNGATSKWINTRMKTINGQSINGDGNISVGGGASGNYLPLTGGTMVGDIYVNSSATAGPIGGIARITSTSDHVGGLVIQLGYGNGGVGNYNRFEIINAAWNKAGFIVDNDCITQIGGTSITASGTSDIACKICASSGNHFPLAAGSPSRGIILGTDNNGDPTVGIYGTSSIIIRLGGRVKVDNGLEIFNLADNLPYIDFHYNNSSSDFTSRIIEYSSGKLTFECYVGINTNSPSYRLHVAGDIYATGAVTALSDARKKDVQKGVEIGVEQIANAPAVQFLWKGERAKEGVQVGTLAQYWQGVLPEVVMDKGGELSMQYGVAALVSAIITARKVVDHERRISELEKENERLKTEVEQLRLN